MKKNRGMTLNLKRKKSEAKRRNDPTSKLKHKQYEEKQRNDPTLNLKRKKSEAKRRNDPTSKLKRIQSAEKKRLERPQKKKQRQWEKLHKEFEKDTGFEVICCCCNVFKGKHACRKANKLSLEQENTYLLKDESFNMSKDSEFYICNNCFMKIKSNTMPTKNEKDMFQWSNFPKSLLDQVEERSKIEEVSFPNVKKTYEHNALMLNKLESFILKLVIPFVRVAHCKRGRYLMVKGNLILISNDIEHSISRILPPKQQLLPVSFKQKLEYQGSYLEEWIDVEKVKCYFQWFKMHNPLFKEVELSEELIQQFENDTLTGAKEFEDLAA